MARPQVGHPAHKSSRDTDIESVRQTFPRLLDTSAFRGLSSNRIQELMNAGRIPTVSTLTLAELIYHLDELRSNQDAAGSFAYRKRQLTKAYKLTTSYTQATSITSAAKTVYT